MRMTIALLERLSRTRPTEGEDMARRDSRDADVVIDQNDSRIYRKAAIAMRLYSVQNSNELFWSSLAHGIENYAERVEKNAVEAEEAQTRGESYSPLYFNPWIFGTAKGFLEMIGQWDPAEFDKRAHGA